MDISKIQQQLAGTESASRPIPPVEEWDPPFCGDMNMVITLDGRWFYEDSPIGRPSLVRLFASVLKKEADRYFLVTPVEKVGLTVEDVPFVITNWRQDGDTYILTTQTGDECAVGKDHPIALRPPPAALADPDATPIPYIRVRRNLWARLHQNVYYQLLEQATSTTDERGVTRLTLTSQGHTYPLGEMPAGQD